MPEGWNTSLDALHEEEHAKLKQHLATNTSATARALNGSKLLKSWTKMSKDINNDGSFGVAFPYEIITSMNRVGTEGVQYGDVSTHVRMTFVDLPEIKNIPTRKKKAQDLLALKGSSKWGKTVVGELRRMVSGQPLKQAEEKEKIEESVDPAPIADLAALVKEDMW